MPPQERDGIQASFCAGEVRVMVATVAFGMGLDAPGVRGVVHATLPRSLEEYVQQVREQSSWRCSAILPPPYGPCSVIAINLTGPHQLPSFM